MFASPAAAPRITKTCPYTKPHHCTCMCIKRVTNKDFVVHVLPRAQLVLVTKLETGKLTAYECNSSTAQAKQFGGHYMSTMLNNSTAVRVETFREGDKVAHWIVVTRPWGTSHLTASWRLTELGQDSTFMQRVGVLGKDSPLMHKVVAIQRTYRANAMAKKMKTLARVAAFVDVVGKHHTRFNGGMIADLVMEQFGLEAM